MQKRPQLSFIIPVWNEEKSIEILAKEIISVCKKIRKSYEIIFVDDGSSDKSYSNIKKLHRKNKKIKAIKLRSHFGKSTALMAGFNRVSAKLIFTMDSDLQDNPIEIPNFLKKLNKGYDMISGWKKTRKDPLFGKIVPSRIFNFITSKLTCVNIHDFNCGFKLYKKEVIKDLNLYGELYRFIPALVAQKGYKVEEIPIRHRYRRFGKSKYGFFRMFKGFLDLITIVFLTSYVNRPGHFFGALGIIFFIPGFLIGLYISYLRIITGGISYRYPLLFLGVLLMIVGIQFISTGLLAEMIISSKEKQNQHKKISEIL